MTFLGKVLVFLHLVLSVFFMAFAGAVYTAQTNWRNETDKTKKALSDANSRAQADQAALNSQLEVKTRDLTALQNEKVNLEGQVKTLTDENARLDGDNKNLKVAFDNERVIAELNSQESDERVKETQIQRARNSELNKSRDEKVSELNDLRDKHFALGVKLEQTTQRYEQLLKDVAVMRAFLASKNLPTEVRKMTTAAAPPPSVDGKVLEARKESRGSRVLVEISLGSDDGLFPDNTLSVIRDGKYLGKIRLDSVGPDRSVGVVVELTPNSKIQKDDNVSTRF